MPWLKVATVLYVATMTSGFVYAGYRALLNLRELYRREGYEQGARDALEDEINRKGKRLELRARLFGR